ncbi:MAG TPA: discoidin domain-containing protein [Candidatus Methylacidiphilales bacterium]|nr:discoidin domain-containing protein [Candidatus Methylacidiphilales bacterium]
MLIILFVLNAAGTGARAAVASEWVYAGPDGKLVYKTTPAGDRIMDFSTAGYMGGGVALPDVRVVKTVQPSGGADDTEAIQAAINEVAGMPITDGFFAGAVLLGPGTFTCSKTISIPSSGIVLRGSGSGAGGTTIKMTGSRHVAIVIGGGRMGGGRTPSDNDPDPEPDQKTEGKPGGAHTVIADAYVPAGATAFTVADAKGFAVGDTISIRRPTTAAWVKFMGMDDLTRGGGHQNWIALSRSGFQERKITAISGNKITVDLPLADSYDAKYLSPPGTTVTKVRPASPVTQVGVEDLHIQCAPLEVAYGHAPYAAIHVGGDDCWVKNVYCEETMNSTVLLGKRITMEGVTVTHTFPNLGASKPSDFGIQGSQILIDRCKDVGGNTYFVWTTSLVPGPNVVLNSVFSGHGSRIQPHMRWSTGLLVDNCTVPDGGIDFPNRGSAGSGHGWTMGWGVVWNCIAKAYVIQQPPGACNWAIGCIGQRVQTARYFDDSPILPEGIFDSYGTPVAPQSLYLAQLAERLGTQAIRNIGYASNTADMFPGKSTPPLPALSSVADPVLGPDLALHRPVNAGSVRNGSAQFEGEKAVDGDLHTYWAANDGVNQATLEVDMEGPVQLNALTLEEASGTTGHVQQYKVEGQGGKNWTLLAQGATINGRQVAHFPAVTVWKVRLTILKSQGYPAISEFGLYDDKNASSGTSASAR